MATRQEQLDSIKREKSILEKQDSIMAEIRNLQRDVQTLLKGFEASTWGEKVEDMEDADIEEITPREETDA